MSSWSLTVYLMLVDVNRYRNRQIPAEKAGALKAARLWLSLDSIGPGKAGRRMAQLCLISQNLSRDHQSPSVQVQCKPLWRWQFMQKMEKISKNTMLCDVNDRSMLVVLQDSFLGAIDRKSVHISQIYLASCDAFQPPYV